MDRRTMRRAQVIMGAGPGAVLDMLGESFVGEDTSQWRGRPEVIRAPRIAAYFGVPELRTPTSAEERGPGLPYYRFPQWLFCGSCRDMTKWNPRREKPGQPPRCETCSARSQLVPMRFVAVCGNGHLDDVNWVRWAHSRRTNRDQAQCGKPKLHFLHRSGVGGGLDSLEVRCSTCNAARDLRDLTRPEAMKSVGVSCRGRQPWQCESDRRELRPLSSRSAAWRFQCLFRTYRIGHRHPARVELGQLGWPRRQDQRQRLLHSATQGPGECHRGRTHLDYRAGGGCLRRSGASRAGRTAGDRRVPRPGRDPGRSPPP